MKRLFKRGGNRIRPAQEEPEQQLEARLGHINVPRPPRNRSSQIELRPLNELIPDYDEHQQYLQRNVYIPEEVIPHTDPIFTPNYLQNLIEHNGNVITPNLISHIRYLNPNLTFRQIHDLPYVSDALDRATTDDRSGNVMRNALRQHEFDPEVGWGPFPNDLDNLYYNMNRNVPGERPPNPSAGPNDDSYHNRVSGPTGEGLLRHHKSNKWITHVKAYSKKHNIPYHLAIKYARATYR